MMMVHPFKWWWWSWTLFSSHDHHYHHLHFRSHHLFLRRWQFAVDEKNLQLIVFCYHVLHIFPIFLWSNWSTVLTIVLTTTADDDPINSRLLPRGRWTLFKTDHKMISLLIFAFTWSYLPCTLIEVLRLRTRKEKVKPAPVVFALKRDETQTKICGKEGRSSLEIEDENGRSLCPTFPLTDSLHFPLRNGMKPVSNRWYLLFSTELGSSSSWK